MLFIDFAINEDIVQKLICDNVRLFDICALPILDQEKCNNIHILQIHIPQKLWIYSLIDRISFLKQCLFQINTLIKYNSLYQTTWIPSIHTNSPNACDIIYADIKWKSIIKYVVTFSIYVIKLCIFILFGEKYAINFVLKLDIVIKKCLYCLRSNWKLLTR